MNTKAITLHNAVSEMRLQTCVCQHDRRQGCKVVFVVGNPKSEKYLLSCDFISTIKICIITRLLGTFYMGPKSEKYLLSCDFISTIKICIITQLLGTFYMGQKSKQYYQNLHILELFTWSGLSVAG